MSRIVVMFCDSGSGPERLCESVLAFVSLNAVEISKFKILVYLVRPDAETADMVKSKLADITPYITVGLKPPCVPCIWKKHRVRYGIIIPTDYIAQRPLWPYLDEIRHTLLTVPNLTHIRLGPDTDATNLLTRLPLVYHYHTRHIMLGNGNIPARYPVLLKSDVKPSRSTVSGVLNEVVFSA